VFQKTAEASQGITEVFQKTAEASQGTTEEVFQKATEASQGITEVFQATEASSNARKKKTYKTIAPQRCRGVLLGIPSKVEAVTDMKSIALAKGHNMQKGDSRRECVSYKIDGKISREAITPGGRQFGKDLTNVEFAKTVNTRCQVLENSIAFKAPSHCSFGDVLGNLVKEVSRVAHFGGVTPLFRPRPVGGEAHKRKSRYCRSMG
jgi:hypothetical protein